MNQTPDSHPERAGPRQKHSPKNKWRQKNDNETTQHHFIKTKNKLKRKITETL